MTKSAKASHFLTDGDNVAKFMDLSHDPGDIIEIRHRYRHPDGSVRVTGTHFNDTAQAAEYACEVSDREGTIAVWTNLNEINPDVKIEKLTKTENIRRRKRMTLDVEATRIGADQQDSNATDAECEEAIAKAQALRQRLTAEFAWTDPLLRTGSGNGGHLDYIIDQPVEGNLIERVLAGIAKLTDAKLDTSIFDAARVVKVAGTACRKAPHSAERPWRGSRTLEVSDLPREQLVVTTEMLERVAVTDEELAAMKADKAARASEATDPFDSVMAPSKFDVGDWLRTNGEKFKAKTKTDGANKYEIRCVIKPESTDGGMWIIQDSDGAITAGCHHDSCKEQGVGWKEIRRKIDPHFRETVKCPNAKTVKDSEYPRSQVPGNLPAGEPLPGRRVVLPRGHLDRADYRRLEDSDTTTADAGLWAVR